MHTIIEELENRTVVKLSGRLDTTSAPDVELAIKLLPGAEAKDMVFDCTELKYISSSGLRVILGKLKEAKAAGKTVYLKNVSPVIREVLDVTGFSSLLEFE